MPTYYPLSIFMDVIANLYPDSIRVQHLRACRGFQRVQENQRFWRLSGIIIIIEEIFHSIWEIPALIVTLVLPQVFSDSPRRLEDSPARRWDWEKRQDLNPFTFLVKYSLYKCEKLSTQCHRLHNWNWNGDELACLKVSVCRPVSVMMCKKSFSELWNVFLSKF